MNDPNDNRSVDQRIREDYGEEAYQEMLRKRREEPEDHDGDKDPLDFGYSGPD